MGKVTYSGGNRVFVPEDYEKTGNDVSPDSLWQVCQEMTVAHGPEAAERAMKEWEKLSFKHSKKVRRQFVVGGAGVTGLSILGAILSISRGDVLGAAGAAYCGLMSVVGAATIREGLKYDAFDDQLKNGKPDPYAGGSSLAHRVRSEMKKLFGEEAKETCGNGAGQPAPQQPTATPTDKFPDFVPINWN